MIPLQQVQQHFVEMELIVSVEAEEGHALIMVE
jgi:hypothetical protein